MRRLLLVGLLAWVAVGLLSVAAEAWSGSTWSGSVAHGGTRFGSPFPGHPLGERQTEA
jgi:hypothetical protein